MPPQGGKEATVATNAQAVQKLLRAKEAQRKAFLRKQLQEEGEEGQGGDKETTQRDPRLPPGQRWAKGGKWVVIDLRTSDFPFNVHSHDWSLCVEGLGGADTPARSYSLKELQAAAAAAPTAAGVGTFEQDLHCVTQCSVKGLRFVGVRMRDLIAMLQPRADWRYLLQWGADGYTANVPRSEVEAEEALFAWAMEDECGNTVDIPYEHGCVRFLFPQLYGWKGCKWPVRIRFSPVDEPGFWERRGGHERGRTDRQERFDMTRVSVLGPWAMRLGGQMFRSERLRPLALFAQRSMGRYYLLRDRVGKVPFLAAHACVALVLALLAYHLLSRVFSASSLLAGGLAT